MSFDGFYSIAKLRKQSGCCLHLCIPSSETWKTAGPESPAPCGNHARSTHLKTYTSSANVRLGVGCRQQIGEIAMEFASCYDHNGTVFATSIFLAIMAVLIILAGLAEAKFDP